MMINSDFLALVAQNLPFNPNESQKSVILTFFDFLLAPESVFLLKGYAGTGKSSLIGGIIKTLVQANRHPVLMAPTGRAAKVFSAYAERPAFTIHRKIYRQKKFSTDGGLFEPTPNLSSNILFFVDEASMISNEAGENRIFGTGRLLDDLVHHVYNGRNCKLVLIGDTAQLPPVGQPLSPAMDAHVLSGYDLNVVEVELTEVVRQSLESGILCNATLIRNQIEERYNLSLLPRLDLNGYPDIQAITTRELPELIDSSYSRCGVEQTLLVTRSNLLANRYNQEIRYRVLYREEELSAGDWLIISKNNYLWLAEYLQADPHSPNPPFIANGEIVLVERVRRQTEVAGLRFVEVQLYLPDQDLSIEAQLMLDTLTNGLASLPREQNELLAQTLLVSYTDLTQQRERYRRLKSDPYYNALQVKFAYSVTAHKAQGGQWREVYIDLSNLNKDHLGIDFYRWLYTSITRATERVYLINTPQEMV